MTFVAQDDFDELKFRVAVPLDDATVGMFDILALDVMRLPVSTDWTELKPHQRTQYRKVVDGVQSGHLMTAMWDVEAIDWCHSNLNGRWDYNLAGWLHLADECITLTFKDREAAMLFKLTWCGS